MTEAFTGNTSFSGSGAPATSQGSSGAPASPATSQEGSGATPSSSPAFDPTKFDWESNIDNVPWEKVDIKRIEKIPGVSKMQRSLAQKLQMEQERAQAETRALQAQLQQYQALLAGQYPEMQPHIQQIQNQGEQARLQAELERYHRQESIRALSEQYDVPADYFEDNPPADPMDAVFKAAEYHRTARVTTESQLQQQLAEMKRQLDALTNRATDPAANQDVGVRTPAGNSFQTSWEGLMREGKFREANKLLREAQDLGLEINEASAKPPGWI